MRKTDKKKLYELAKRIKAAGKEIAADSIAKDYYLMGFGEKDNIIITSDSGYEAISIGNIYADNGCCFMNLYSSNTYVCNSFPDTKTIAALLEKVVNEEYPEEGDGKATYYDWEEYGSMEKQLKYFSKVVCKAAGITNTCNV